MKKMKDSGIEWISKIPESWELRRLKYILKERKEKNSPVVTDFILSLSMERGVFPYSEKTGGGNKAKDDLTAYKVARPNDIVLNSMNILSGAVGISKWLGAVSPVYYTYYSESDAINVNYYHYLFQSKEFQRSLLGLGNGILMKESDNGKLNTIRMRIPSEKFNRLVLPIPSRKEQDNIVSFLDEKVAKIDGIIADTKLSIDKLKDYKQSVITEVVTVGVNGNLKDEDFESKKFKYLYKTGKGLTVTKADLVEEGIPTISYGQIHSYTTTFFDATGLPSLPSSYYDISSAVLERGDIVFADTSEDIEGSGDFSVKDTDEIILAGYHDVVAKPLKTNNNNYKFIGYYLESNVYREQLRSMVQGVKVYSISQRLIKQTKLRLPNLHEQELIANYLDEKTKTIDELITDKESLISKYEDYKKSMIYEYVTGKKRVQ